MQKLHLRSITDITQYSEVSASWTEFTRKNDETWCYIIEKQHNNNGKKHPTSVIDLSAAGSDITDDDNLSAVPNKYGLKMFQASLVLITGFNVSIHHFGEAATNEAVPILITLLKWGVFSANLQLCVWMKLVVGRI